MSKNFAEQEREFLESLQKTSGRDLAGWMAAIAAEKLAHRNDVIDWLREKGFPFSRASWLERIHQNGGRPLYPAVPAPRATPPPSKRAASKEMPREREAPSVSTPRAAPRATPPNKPLAPSPPPFPTVALTPTPSPAPETPPTPQPSSDDPTAPPLRKLGVLDRPSRKPQSAKPTVPTPEPMSVPVVAPPPPLRPALSPGETALLNEVLGKAKAYRPLAQLFLREIEKTLPSVVMTPHATHVAFGAPDACVVLVVSPKDLRLGLDLGERPFDARLQKAKFAGPGLRIPPNITHMMVLDDARQVNADLMGLVKAAVARTGG